MTKQAQGDYEARMAVRYRTFRICVLPVRTSHLQPYCTSIPYFSSFFEAYRTNVPYLRPQREIFAGGTKIDAGPPKLGDVQKHGFHLNLVPDFAHN